MKGVQRTIRGDIIFSFFFVGASMCCSFVICSIDWLVVFASLMHPTCVIFLVLLYCMICNLTILVRFFFFMDST